MSDLRARLRHLRGGRGEPDAPAPAPRPAEPAGVPGGVTHPRPEGLAHVAARRFAGAAWGRVPLAYADPPAALQRWAGASSCERFDPEEVVFLDTETTGLAGGTGTFVFLVGLGRFDADGFAVEQHLLLGPQHERAHLNLLAERVRGARVLVSYNGASFDLPQLRTRFALHDLDDPFAGALHLDLLPTARRLWGEALPDCRLGTVERHLFGAVRSGEDVPGALVPARYAQFLRAGDPEALRGVLEHNGVDVAALAALQAYLAHLFDGRRQAGGAERRAMARLLEAAGEPEAALAAYGRCEPDDAEAAWRASLLEKRLGRTARAEARWGRLAAGGHAGACLELAKLAEHRRGDVEAALTYVAWARAATPPVRRRAHAELDHREARLRRKRDGTLGA